MFKIFDKKRNLEILRIYKFIIATMTTVWYVYAFPKITFGRLVGVWICWWGSYLFHFT